MSIAPQRLATAARLASACAAVGAAGVFVATAIAAAGGGLANLRAITVGLRAPWTALGIGVVFTLVAAWLDHARARGAAASAAHDRAYATHMSAPAAIPPALQQGPEPVPASLPSRSSARGHRAAALAVAVCAGVVAWAYGTESAAGADASGYLNAAKLFAAGSASIAQPLAADAPWPDALRTMAPLGFRVGRDPQRLVPTYPPGLPLVYAVAMHVHPRAWTFVVPALAATVVFVTFLVGARFTSPRAALLAASGMAASPVFLFHAVQPMSDVPATAWWMLAVTCALHRTPGWSVASGLAAGAAILTRPNLAPLAFAVLLLVWLAPRRASGAVRTGTDAAASVAVDADASRSVGSARHSRRAAAACVLAMLPAVIGAAWLNNRLYGHPLESGYGPATDLFSLSYVATNVTRYSGWVADVHPVAAVAALLGAVIYLARWPSARSAGRARRDSRPAIVALAGVVALNVGAYLVYAPFENWTYLRFLLPSFPLVALAAASTIDHVLARLPRLGAATAVTAALCGLVAGGGIRDAAARGVFERRTVDARHELIAHAFNPGAASRVFITQQHGGAVLFHTGAPVLRWDLIDPDALDGALAWLTTRGLTPVFLLDADEEPVFRSRFAGRGAWAGLDWPAHVATAPPQRARAYELPDRARFEAGARWSPQQLRR